MTIEDPECPRSRVQYQDTDGGEHQFQVAAGENLLAAGLDAGIPMRYSCCAGICTSCRALLLEGRVQMAEQDVLTPEELFKGYILCCQSVPGSAAIKVRAAP